MGNSYMGTGCSIKGQWTREDNSPSQFFAKETKLFTTNSSPTMANTIQLEKLSFWVYFILNTLNKTTSTQPSNFLSENFNVTAKYVSTM